VAVGALPGMWTEMGPDPAIRQWAEALFSSTHHPNSGRAVFLAGEPGEELLRLLDQWIPADLSWEPREREILYCHRRTPQQDVYFVFNQARRPVSGVVTIASAGTLEIWDPWAGTRATSAAVSWFDLPSVRLHPGTPVRILPVHPGIGSVKRYHQASGREQRGKLLSEMEDVTHLARKTLIRARHTDLERKRRTKERSRT